MIILTAQKGLVFDIQGYSVHDGPGCRTLVFLSGCPLRCEWCANPEGMEIRQQVMFSTTKCRHTNLNCTRCLDACHQKAIELSNDENILKIDRSICRNCGTYDCTNACFYEAIRLVGKWMSVDELMEIFNRDRQYWGQGGGVTFSGGEPFIQKDFLLEVLKKCKKAFIHTAIETTAHVATQVLLDTFRYVDFAFIDIKHMDSQKHKEKTGVGNELILNNIAALANSDWKGRLVLRMPVIRNYNDTDENVMSIIRFMKKLGLFEINILPFHRLGDSKWKQLGLNYLYSDEEGTSEEKLDHIQDLFLDERIACYVAHDTLF